ncbi:pyrroloquinoline quinone biosynthesis peptide chaperone PqqD [Rhodobacter calidifons]|uniref:pyrroloquinoline quinone biosynthesis peptide chaperone PqqD n=1 Tax=Rhodobacter calidifons TaxID=2715277 RepID=UPI00349EEAF1
MIPVLPPGVRLHWDAVRGSHVLLAPERVLMLDEVGHAILSRVDGATPVDVLVSGLAADFAAPVEEVGPDVTEFLTGLALERLVDLHA